MYDAFEAGRELADEDILQNLTNAVPLAQTMEAQITALRQWAYTHARAASPRDSRASPPPGLRQMELN